MKKYSAIILLSVLMGSSFANTTTTTVAPASTTQQPIANAQQPTTTTMNSQQPAQQSSAVAQPQATQQVQQAQKKPQTKKHQKPAFSHNEMWCGDTHIKNQNADKIGDYCKDFDYKHDVVQFKDDRSGRLVHCEISDTGQIKQASCHPVK